MLNGNDQSRDIIGDIVRWADANPLIRAVILTSTRAVPSSAVVDVLSDYDVIVYVTDIAPFRDSDEWMTGLGTVLVRTELERRTDHDMPALWRGVIYDDTTKVDYTIAMAAVLPIICSEPGLPDELDLGYRVLLDKDALTVNLKEPTFKAHIPAKPSAMQYQALVENFWWNSTYAAKYLWRGELFAARAILDYEIRLVVLEPLLGWVIETENGWSVRSGLFGRQLNTYLTPDLWAAVEKTFAGPGIDAAWQALFNMIEVFRRGAQSVAISLGYEYPIKLDEQMTTFVKRISGFGARKA